MWANYEYLNYTSFVGQYVKVGCDIIDAAMAIQKVHIKNLQIPVFATYLKKYVSVLSYYCNFRELPKFYNVSDGKAKR